MGRGRAPCCEKVGLNRGPWTPEEDNRLVMYIHKYGHGNWRALPKQAGLLRCGKSCRLRWINYLRPDVKRGNFSTEEEETVIKLHRLLGNKWSRIASCLPGRTDNEIKNVWNTHLKKRVMLEVKKIDDPANSPSQLSSISSCNQSDDRKDENSINDDEEKIEMPIDSNNMDVWATILEDFLLQPPEVSQSSASLPGTDMDLFEETADMPIELGLWNAIEDSLEVVAEEVADGGQEGWLVELEKELDLFGGEVGPGVELEGDPVSTYFNLSLTGYDVVGLGHGSTLEGPKSSYTGTRFN